MCLIRRQSKKELHGCSENEGIIRLTFLENIANLNADFLAGMERWPSWLKALAC